MSMFENDLQRLTFLKRTIALFSSMIDGKECHTARSKEMKNNAQQVILEMEADVVQSQKQIKLTSQEQSTIENALNAYWNEAYTQLENNGVYMLDGTKRPLGDIERQQLEQRKELTFPILKRFENL